MKFIKKIGRFLKTKTGIISAAVLALIVIFALVKGGSAEENLYTLTSDNLSATGIMVGATVVAQEEVDLSFETSGRVASVSRNAGDRVSQGQVIASLDTGTASSNVLKAQADLDAEVAKLNEYKNQNGSGLTEVETRKNQIVREMRNSYTVSEDAVKSKVDQFFENPNMRFPKMYTSFGNPDLRAKANEGRYQVGLTLDAWRVWSASLNTSSYSDNTVGETKDNIAKVQAFLDQVAVIVNEAEATEFLPQATLDKYRSDVSSARAAMDKALNDLNTAEEALRSTSSQIPYQEARVKSARAVVQNYQAELEKSIIRAPFNGLVTKQDAKVGMSAMGDQALVSMISDSNYGVDTYVPEIYISQIKVGNKAKVVLNSYGSVQEFGATVTHVDPAASQRDGVASYKVELVFDGNDDRIKSGMTGDVEIMTDTVNPSFWIPLEAVTDQGGASYVKVKSGDSVELRTVQTGERNATQAEVLSGLIVGDQVVLPKK